MKKALLFFALILVFQSQLNAQDKALLGVDYEFKHIYNLAEPEKPSTTVMRLYIGQKNSEYMDHGFAETVEKQMERFKEIIAKQPAGAQIKRNNMTNVSVRDGGETLIIIPQEQKAFMHAWIGQQEYKVPLDYKAQNWIIHDETREIGGFSCQKATANFAGRDYIAWFAPELPFNLGPWKLHGLPGLILEAEDSTGEVQFLFKDIVKMDDIEKNIEVPENAVQANLKDYKRAKKAHDANPLGPANANSPAGSTVQRMVVTIGNDGTRKTLTGDEAVAHLKESAAKRLAEYNNPIEKD